MIHYIMFVIAFVGDSGVATMHQYDEVYSTMIECFEERDKVVKKMGRPIINYQVICIATDKIRGV